ncbi:hypothetical protein GQX73_g304 [Xylaria multiplex]|uniref:Actin-like ATPase domain-containing protein n=1 Tax=Xylaria multiplex TaxID=323545 RepID=A0A7C8IVB1_9PEZI|nr:hypothetical protein GQX73_g304 [Xylaria multiplex]
MLLYYFGHLLLVDFNTKNFLDDFNYTPFIMPRQANRNGVIVIGIDFGTTFTGVAYDYLRRSHHGQSDLTPLPITLWPASNDYEENSDSPKVPSSIAYPLNGPIAWGQQVSDEQGAIRWFKLLLLDETDLQQHLKNSEHIKKAREAINKTGKDVVTMIADYLARVWHHVLEDIVRARGRQFLNTRSFHVVITVPAIWQDYAIERMDWALKKAGILDKRPGCAGTTYNFVSEPEAAALAAINGHNKYDTLECGQTFIIADLGGGTVDLISFRVKSIKPRLLLEEVVEGEGALCGATFLDQAFLSCLEKKVRQMKQNERNMKSWQQMHPEEKRRIMNTVWEKGIKRKYYDGHSGYRIDLGAHGTRRPHVFLDKVDLNDTFDSVYENVSTLVKGQIDAIAAKTGDLPQFIVLTGGFGRCEYIYRKLNQQYKDRIEILFESNDRPWTAVARGAVLSGVAHMTNQDQVDSHISRYSYGWVKEENFEQGGSVEAKTPLVYGYTRYFEIDDIGFVSFSEPIYRSNLVRPPNRLAENEVIKGDSEKPGEPAEFQKHAVIDMKTPVPVEELPKRGRGEFQYRYLFYEVEVSVLGASLVIKAMFGGEEIGKKVISEFSN